MMLWQSKARPRATRRTPPRPPCLCPPAASPTTRPQPPPAKRYTRPWAFPPKAAPCRARHPHDHNHHRHNHPRPITPYATGRQPPPRTGTTRRRFEKLVSHVIGIGTRDESFRAFSTLQHFGLSALQLVDLVHLDS